MPTLPVEAAWVPFDQIGLVTEDADPHEPHLQARPGDRRSNWRFEPPRIAS